jgi:hypothetical protein
MSLDFGPVAMWFERQRRELAAAARLRRAEEQQAEANALRLERVKRERRTARQRARERSPSHRMVLRSHLERAVSSAGVPGALSAETRDALERFRGLCKCARCGIVGAKDFFFSRGRCTDCEMVGYERDPEGWFSERLARDAASRSVRVGVQYDIDATWVRTAFATCKRKCALCGDEMGLQRKRQRVPVTEGSLFANFPLNASLDQRVAGAGYTRDNAQLVHVRCNLAKLDMSQADFVAMCSAVAKHHAKQAT